MSLRIARKIAKLSQKELSERAAVDISTINRVERGSRDLSATGYHAVARLAAVLNLDADELIAIAKIPDPIRRHDPGDRTNRSSKARTKAAARATSSRAVAATTEHV